VDFKTRRELYNGCHPAEPLAPTDRRNVPFDQFEAAGHKEYVRGVDWVDRLAVRIELSDDPVCMLFTGLRGSGKSTELLRLQARLSDPHRAPYLVVVVDAEEHLDLTNPVDVPDILASLVAAAEQRVLEAEGKPAEPGFLERLWTWLNNTDVTLKEAEFSVGDHAKLTLELKTRPTLRQRVTRIISSHLSHFLKLVHDELVLLDGRAQKCRHTGLVLILDSLEKLQGMSHNYDDVLSSAERLFGGGAPYLTLPVHVLYTVPPALTARRAFHDVSFLPMVLLKHRDGSRSEPGFRALRELVRRRVTDAELEAQLGGDYEARIARLIEWSGGYPRELVRLLQSLWTYAEAPLSDSELARLCHEVTDSYRKVIRTSDIKWLVQVASEHYAATDDEAGQQSADRMLSSNAVLRYLNNQDWFDLHPAVRAVPEVAAAIARSKQKSKAPP